MIHQMTVEADTGEELLFVCPEPGCGRRMVLNLQRNTRVVLEDGDRSARHAGFTGISALGVEGARR